jgi:hypothetical protein
MVSEWKQSSTVGEGGRVQVVIPELHPGEVVEVAVRYESSPRPAERPLGLLAGRIRVMPDFDEPLEEFENLD